MRTRYVWMGAVALAASLVFADSWAGDHGQPPPHNPAPPPTSVSAGAVAGAVSGSVSHATGGTANAVGIGGWSSSDSSATGGNATGGTSTASGGNGYGGVANGGTGGTGGAGGAGGEASSVADGSSRNAIDASSTTTVERSVGALVMGTLLPVDCGTGGQAGGANTHASGILGITWTTDRCYTLKAANAWAAMGEYELACEMLVDVTKPALKRRHRVPDCTVIGYSLRLAHTPEPVVIREQSLVPSAPMAPPANFVTPEQMRDYVDRAFKKSVGK